MKRLAVLGSTGSIGQQTLEVVRAFPGEFQVVGLAAGNNLDLLVQQAHEFFPKAISSQRTLSQDTELPSGCKAVSLVDIATHPDVDLVVMATVGHVGLTPTIEAIRAGKPIALANKEVIVMAGELIRQEVERCGTALLPMDSEPSAIWQCLLGDDKEIARLFITASGGAFRGRALGDLKDITPEEALQHPTWSMGRKITVDSATLMNKAFEVMEAHWLFGIPWEQIEVVVHPQSIIHSMVEFADGSVKAQLSSPDMRLPIQYALFYPERQPNPFLTRFDPLLNSPLTFEPVDMEQYPCFPLAVEMGKQGGTWPAVVAAADEVAVELFLRREVGFLDIHHVVAAVVERHQPVMSPSLEDILATDAWARETTLRVVR